MSLFYALNGSGFTFGGSPPPPAAATSTKWRLYITDTIGGGVCTFAELEMRTTPGGAQECVGGTVSASSEWNASEAATKVLDGISTSYWTCASGDWGDKIAWWQYDFAAPISIVQLAIQARSNALPYNLKDFQLQYWDGAAWQTALTVTGEPAWTAYEWRTYDVP